MKIKKNNKLKLLSAISMLLTAANPAVAMGAELALATPPTTEVPQMEVPLTLAIERQSPLVLSPKLALGLAHLYETGQGVQRSDDIAFRLYRYAAHNGLADAQYALALMYSDERAPINIADTQLKALYWMERAATQGHKDAQFSYEYLLNNTHYAGC